MPSAGTSFWRGRHPFWRNSGEPRGAGFRSVERGRGGPAADGRIDRAAPLRHRSEIRVIQAADVAWVRWTPPRPDVIDCLLAAPAVQFFVEKSGQWQPFRRRLPGADRPPLGEGTSLAALLVPAPFQTIPPGELWIDPLALRLVRDTAPRPATAMWATLAALASWADRATTHEIESVRAARCGDRVLLLGDRLPAIPGAARYWGKDFLVPLGFRPDPDLPTATLREAIGAAENELAVLKDAGAERVPREAFRKLSRAAIRLAVREGGAA